MNYKVSVIITSYNHAHTISRAINSVLSQITPYKIQIIVIDDGSTNGSIKIIQEYYDRGLINVIQGMDHCGMMRAYAEGFKRCKGEYIMFCDCDDYWSDTGKIQKQVEYMDKALDCGLCYTQIEIDNGSGVIKKDFDVMFLQSHITYDNLLKGNAYIHAPTYCIRKSEFDKWIDFEMFAKHFNVWDYPIVLELILHTRFHCLNFHSAVLVESKESVTRTRKRWKRLKYVSGNYKIRLYYILRYGCKLSTIFYLIYRFARDMYAIIFYRW